MLKSISKITNCLFSSSITKNINTFNKINKSMLYKHSYQFTRQIKTIDQAIEKLSEQIDVQLKFQAEHPRDYKQVQAQFAQEGWTIKYNGPHIQLWKQNGPYQIRMVFKVKVLIDIDTSHRKQLAELGDEASQKYLQEEEEEEEDDVGEINVYVQKQGNTNWLFFNFLISLKEETELQLTGFVNDFEADTKQRERGLNPPFQLLGPQIDVMPPDFQDAWFGFIESIGITPYQLQAAVQLGGFYEQEFHLKWLHEVKKFI